MFFQNFKPISHPAYNELEVVISIHPNSPCFPLTDIHIQIKQNLPFNGGWSCDRNWRDSLRSQFFVVLADWNSRVKSEVYRSNSCLYLIRSSSAFLSLTTLSSYPRGVTFFALTVDFRFTLGSVSLGLKVHYSNNFWDVLWWVLNPRGVWVLLSRLN